MDTRTLISRYIEKLGLKNTPTSSEGIIHLNLDSMVLTFEESQDLKSFYLYSGLGEILPHEEKSVFEEVLQGNLFGVETGRASLGLVPGTHILILFEKFIVAEWNDQEFEEEVTTFTHTLENWLKKIDQLKTSKVQSLSNISQLRGLQEAGNMRIFFA